jgi:hypothetical protein
VSGSGTGINLASNTGATINFTGTLNLNTGANAAFTATGGGTVNAPNTDGTITSVGLINPGSGFTSAPTVAITGGGGTGATATSTCSVSVINVTAGGSGFTSAPTVTLSGGGGSGAAATAFVFGGSIVGVFVTNGGSGYTSAPSVSFTGGGGSGATASALLRVAAVNVTNGGSGFTSTPSVSFSGGGGTNASAYAVLHGVSTITTSTGTALNIANTNIGSGGLRFLSINVSGATKGIILNSTGTGAGNGGLSVTGTATTDGSGGTIQNTSNRGAEFITTKAVSLKNMTLTNAGTTDLDATNGGLSTGDNLDTNAAIHLQSVTTATLDNVDISGGAEQGINGNTVSDFVLTNSTITNVGNAADEDNIHFFNMSGTSAITNTTLTHTSGGGDDNMNLQTQSGTLRLTISGGSANGAAGGVLQQGSGYLFGIRGTTDATITFVNANSNNNFSGGIVADAFDNCRMDLTVTNSTSTANNDQLSVSAGDNSVVNLTAISNSLSSVATGDFVVLGLLGSAFDNGFKFSALIQSNNITVANGLTTDAMSVFNAGGGQMNVAFLNNTFDYAGTQRVLLIQAGQDGPGNVSSVVTGNNMNIQLDGMGNGSGILAQATVASPTGDNASVDLDIGGAGALANNFTHSLGGTIAAGDIRVRQRVPPGGSGIGGTATLTGFTGPATDLTAVTNYLNGRNNEVSPSTATADSSGFTNGVAVSVSPTSVSENGGNLVYTLSRTGNSLPALLVTFNMSGSASFGGAGADYTVIGATTYNASTGQGTVTIPAGTNPSVTITIDPTNDGVFESDESVFLDVIGGTFARGVITNDDTTSAPDVASAQVNDRIDQLSVASPVESQVSAPVVWNFNVPQSQRGYVASKVTPQATSNDVAITTASLTNSTFSSQPSSPYTNNRDVKLAVYRSDDAGIPNLRPASHVVTAAAQNKLPDKSPTTPQAGETVQITTPFTLPANKSVTIKFQATIPDPAGVTQISTRGTVSGTNFSAVQTTDPGPPVVNGPTVTPVDFVDTTTTLMSSDTTTVAGEAVTFTATVARTNPGAGTITGTVQFKDGAANLGSPVTIASGQAQLTTSCLPVGNRSITAVYSGDTNFKTSTSTSAVSQTVSPNSPVFVDDSFAGSTDCQDLGGGKIFGRNAFATIATGIAGVAVGGTVNVAEGTYAENVIVGQLDTLTLSGNVTISGNLTIAGGTFNSTSGVLSITGNFNQTGGAFNTNSGTVAMTGSAAQILGGTVQTTFNNLRINNAAGVSLGVNKTGVGTLDLMNGNFNAATFTYELTATGASTRTSGHVLGNLKKTYSATGSFTYHVGTVNGYSPVTVNVTAGTGDLTVKAVQGPQPTLNAMKSLQRYWTLAGTGITVNMTFSYIDPTDIMGNEAAYRVIRVEGATAVIYDDSPPTSFVDEAANTINVQNISGFSDWTAGEATGPTAVEDVSLEATGYDGGVYVHWRTGSEVSNLGFNLYRDEGGQRVLVNPQPIAGSALAAGPTTQLGAGGSYGWWDSGPGRGVARYWVEDIDLSGQTRLHGPFIVKHAGGSPPDRTPAALLSKVGDRQSGITQPVAITAPMPTGAAQRGPAAAQLAGQAAIKLAVKREGFYGVMAADLVTAGLDVRTDPARLQLFVDGRQVPIGVKTDNRGALEAVEFYGVGLDTPSTDARVYWLVAGQQPGLRMEQVGGGGRPSSGGSFLYKAERKDRTVYFSALRNGERENFFGAVVAIEPVDQSIVLRHIDFSAQGQASVEIALQGVSLSEHRVWAYVNGAFAGELSFAGQSAAAAKFAIAQSMLREGDNQVRLVAQGGPADISLVDYIRVSYYHSFTADDDALRLTAAGGQSVTVGGFSNRSVRVFDVTVADSVQEVKARVEPQKEGGFAVTVSAAGTGERRLLAVSDERAASPDRVVTNKLSNLNTSNHAADLVIITRGDFLSAFDALARRRVGQGLKVEMVDIEDIYDEFSYGHKSPQAVKDFLSYARTNWKVKPRYVLFGADSSYDAKNYLGLGDWDIAPARLIDTGLMETASDDWYADFNGDGLADMSVGRLPVRTAAEASSVVAKIIGYEQGRGSEEMMLVADSNDTFSFEGANTQLRGLIPPGMRVNEISRGRLDIATARAQLIEAAMRGQKIINYTGHGSVDQWRGGLLTNEDAALLGNSERASVFVMMTCLNSYGLDPALDSLAEALMKTERGGAVAVWASSGMTNPDAQAEMNQQLYRLVFGAGGSQITLGELTGRAKAAISDRDIRVTWMLIGDPTMKIR